MHSFNAFFQIYSICMHFSRDHLIFEFFKLVITIFTRNLHLVIMPLINNVNTKSHQLESQKLVSKIVSPNQNYSRSKSALKNCRTFGQKRTIALEASDVKLETFIDLGILIAI